MRLLIVLLVTVAAAVAWTATLTGHTTVGAVVGLGCGAVGVTNWVIRRHCDARRAPR